MRELNEELVDAIQWLAQHQLDGIYTRIEDELRYEDGTKVEPSENHVEALITKCVKNWLATGDTLD